MSYNINKPTDITNVDFDDFVRQIKSDGQLFALNHAVMRELSARMRAHKNAKNGGPHNNHHNKPNAKHVPHEEYKENGHPMLYDADGEDIIFMKTDCKINYRGVEYYIDSMRMGTSFWSHDHEKEKSIEFHLKAYNCERSIENPYYDLIELTFSMVDDANTIETYVIDEMDKYYDLRDMVYSHPHNAPYLTSKGVTPITMDEEVVD